MPSLAIRDLSVEFRASGGYLVRALDRLDGDAEDGHLVLLRGPSGSGKTTLLSVLGGILRPTSGSVRVDGRELTALSDRQLLVHRRCGVGFVFQAFNLIPSLTALENVAAPLLTTGTRHRVAFARARMLLDLVDLTDRAGHRPAELSGGQQQRVAIARGLAQDPPILLADEPTANLDYVQAEGVVSLLRELATPGRLVIVSTHDDRLLPVADHVIDLVPSSTGEGASGRRSFAADEVIFEQGTRGELVYLVEEGEVALFRDLADGRTERLAVRGPGSYFGELGPMMGQPRSASARATCATTVTAMSLQEFREHGRRQAVLRP